MRIEKTLIAPSLSRQSQSTSQRLRLKERLEGHRLTDLTERELTDPRAIEVVREAKKGGSLVLTKAKAAPTWSLGAKKLSEITIKI